MTTLLPNAVFPPPLRIVLCGFVTSLAILPAFAAPPTPESAAPQELLAILPKPPVSWKMISSIGRKDLAGGARPTTTATRIYEVKIAEDKRAVPLQIEAVDLLARTDLVDYLKGFAPKSDEGLPIFRAGRFEGALRRESAGGLRLQTVVADRVTIRVQAKDLTSEEFLTLLERLDWDTMAAEAARLPKRTNAKNEFIVGVFYEMEPELSNAATVPVYFPPEDGAGSPISEEASAPPSLPTGP